MTSSLFYPSRRALLTGAGASALAGDLPVPKLAFGADAVRTITARTASAALRGEGTAATPIWGYDGTAPGPVLRVRRGEDLRLRLANELPEPTLVHWHGVRVPNRFDGVAQLAQLVIEPGKSFDYRFTPPDAGTFWYHADLSASRQMARGLAGALIVEEASRVDVDQDVVLVVQEWRDPEHITVNGQPSLTLPVRQNERVRLRLINAASTTIMPLRLERHQPTVMAIDGQPSEPFAPRNARVVLAPGNRVDLFADMVLDAGATSALLLQTKSGETPLVRFNYASGAPARPSRRTDFPALPANSLPERMDFAKAMRVDAPVEDASSEAATKTTAKNAPKRWAPAANVSTAPSLFSVKRGRTVTLALPNRLPVPYAVHVHGHSFRLLDNLDDGWKPYWLDTLLLEPGRTSRIAFVADNPGKWLIHARSLDERAADLAHWFEVT